MAIITLAREVGSGGTTISQLVSQRLGYRVVSRRDLREAAKERGLWLPPSFASFADEQPPVLSATANAPLYLSFGEVEFDLALSGAITTNLATSFLEEMANERQNVLLTVASLIYELASDDDIVFVGGGSQHLLAGIDHAFRVKVIAPRQVRAERLAHAYGLSLSEASDAVARSDREQVEFNQAVYDTAWDDPLHWDLLINTEFWTAEQAADLIARNAPLRTASTDDASAWKASLQAAAEINRGLAQHGFFGSWLLATPSRNEIVVNGDTQDAEQARQAIAVAESLSKSLPIQDNLSVRGVGHVIA